MKIKTKMQLYAAIAMFFVLMAANTAIYVLFNQVSSDSELNRLQTQTNALVEALHQTDEHVDVENLLNAYLPSNGMIRVITRDETTLFTLTKENRFPSLISYTFTTEAQASLVQTDEGERFGIIYEPVIWSDGQVVTLEVSEHFEALENNMETLQLVLFLASLFILLPTFLGGRLLSELFLRPIRSTARTMQDIEQRGELKKINIEDMSKDEIYEMNATFNRMIDRLEENFEKQQHFVSDASHELKTPLSIIDSYTRLLKRWGTSKPDVMAEAIQAILSESERMKKITEQMLMLAKDESTGAMERETFDVIAMARTAVTSFSRSYERHITVQSREDSLLYHGDKEKLKQVIYILLDNALKYSDSDVTVRVMEGDTNIELSVDDHGPGIPKEEQPKIFDRFYRLDKARSRTTGGTGLGLSIAWAIIHAHQGTISIESEPPNGTSFIIDLPK
ncbi:Signal transduction histidine kinase [Alteribacillus persepolensis]|uniref:Signal transduction histidine-protein kinase ArlS n=1 Tax=Alteribacillus persepolensis TaxID=568899 RepID=A0A1G8ETP1_9BACI|nr:HAMP domain-containing histidine kinase [Alteribacillus persepolensis]SDH73258.1 Signal transduction histidine kinase [Alteribacillus persepolensis]